MDIPKNRQMRLGDDVWIASEALSRYHSIPSRRDALEKAIFEMINQKVKTDKAFAEVWSQVKAEVKENG